MPGDIAKQHKGHEDQTSCQGSHQRGGQTFAGAAHYKLWPECLAALILQILIVAEQHHAVAQGESGNGNAASDQTERNGATIAQEVCHHRASQRRGQRDECDKSQAPAAESSLQEQVDAEHCHDTGNEDALHSSLLPGAVIQNLRVIFQRKCITLDSSIDLCGHGSDTASFRIEDDIKIRRNGFTTDHSRRGDHAYIGQFPERDLLAAGDVDE